MRAVLLNAFNDGLYADLNCVGLEQNHRQTVVGLNRCHRQLEVSDGQLQSVGNEQKTLVQVASRDELGQIQVLYNNYYNNFINYEIT